MATDRNLFRVAGYSRIADALIALADKEELAECAQILALAVAQYELKFGEPPPEPEAGRCRSGPRKVGQAA